MKPTILDVLRYLFDHYMDDDWEYTFDRDFLEVELREAGFDARQVDKAFDWLQGLAIQQDTGGAGAPLNTAIRVYTADEQRRLDRKAQGFLLLLEQIGVIGHHTRELVIDRVMALETHDLELSQLKWIVLMVLFNQPDQEEPLMWMEYLLDEGCVSQAH